MKKLSLILVLQLLLAIVLTACSTVSDTMKTSEADRTGTSETVSEASSEIASAEAEQTSSSQESGSSATAQTASTSEYFTERDLDPSYEEAYTITLSDDGSSADHATIDENTITISQEGTYLLTGTLTNGQIVIDAAETAKIQLVLDNVSVTAEGTAAIYVKSADKVFLTTTAGSSNTLSSVGTFTSDGDTNIDGTIFSKDDLTLNGEGSLTILSEQGHGIAAKDDLKITGGTYTITAAKKGIDANDSIRLAAADITVDAGTDAMHVENTEDTSKGYIYILSGTLNLTAAEGDGMDASGDILIEDGIINILAGGGYSNGEAKMDWFGPGQASQTSDSSTSMKGIKSDTSITIANGTIAINSADDALHTNGDLTIAGGTFTIAAGDDAVHADYTLTVTEGNIEILTSHEGFEGYTIDVQGGSISLTANDDGFNAAGSGTPTLQISGGSVSINTNGDGLDSNGSLSISGGVIFVDGPASEGNGSLDYDGEGVITGGSIITTGSSGMAMNFGSSSTQGCILYNCGNQAAGTEVILEDADGNEILRYTAQKAFASVLVSDPDIVQGGTYTLRIGLASVSIEMSSLIYGQGSDGFGGPGGGPGMRR